MLDEEVRIALENGSLRTVEPEILAKLTEGAVRVDVPAGGRPYRPDDGPVFMLVTRGLLRMYMESPAGRQVTLRYARPGSIVGVATIFSDIPLYLAQEALMPSRVLAMAPATVRHLAATDVSLALALLGEASDRVQTYIAVAGADVLGSVRQRVIAHLLEIARYGPGSASGLVASVEQQQLADAAGTVREVVVRILRDMRAEGLVRTGRDGIDLLDPARLEAEVWPSDLVR